MREIKEDISDLRENLKISRNLWFYGHQRYDLLIISISGGGIYLILSIIKYYYELQAKSPNILIPDLTLIKISSILFLISIVANILSQLASITVNRYHIIIRKKEILFKNNPQNITPQDEEEYCNNNCKSKCYNKVNDFFNNSSLFLMLAGIVLVAIYFMQNF